MRKATGMQKPSICFVVRKVDVTLDFSSLHSSTMASLAGNGLFVIIIYLHNILGVI